MIRNRVITGLVQHIKLQDMLVARRILIYTVIALFAAFTARTH